MLFQSKSGNYDVTDYVITTDDDCAINIPVTFDYFSVDVDVKKDYIHCGFVRTSGGRPIRYNNSSVLNVNINLKKSKI